MVIYGLLVSCFSLDNNTGALEIEVKTRRGQATTRLSSQDTLLGNSEDKLGVLILTNFNRFETHRKLGHDGKPYKCSRVDAICANDASEHAREIPKCRRFDREKNDRNWQETRRVRERTHGSDGPFWYGRTL